MLKKLYLGAALICLMPQEQSAAVFTPEQIAIEEKNTSAGRLSEKNESLIKSIMDELGITETIMIRKPLATLIEVAPIYNFESYVPVSGIWYINEAWFNSLSAEEQRYVIGYRLLAIHSKLGDVLVRDAGILMGVQVGLSSGLIYPLYQYLSSQAHLLSFKNSKMKSFLMSYAVVTGIQYMCIAPMIKRITEYDTHKRASDIDCVVATKLNCLNGAISTLEKLQATIASWHAKDTAYWYGLYVTFASRIAKLKKLQLQQAT